ncbi:MULTISPECIES: TauD/TfdA family dioxygenase [unclassified Lysobacter]|uniref:TauD/TfdA family dioxygenase n=1 Tax=unclassified Lysobacter TaxID=2635362 RepID=UPI001BEB180F|nr:MULTISPECIES: TauD/TfdA family dioxygenase [unclassified Lysobacter]MBT2748704.1 TauD/TfdA family dioxygenase [Lysobacter sp. ISL-42]MBT2751639.1 TauD/TfdA family dioxygenase [Lysobacter sp. ISL-50]MBT2775833.1 TauD/TfdA family dioxygenase [Lysobacter sp. ISL-54]MBT2782202.1 TauD/TfdA family dioxygenase [Lysobacter sp. ISL-52]
MQTSMCTIDCSPFHDALCELKRRLPTHPRQDLAGFFSVAAQLSVEIPAPLLKRVSDFRQRGNDDGFLHLKGLPIDEDALPPTPSSYPTPVDRPLLDTEAWIALIGMVVGKATGYKENRFGSVFQDVYPALGAHRLTAHNYDTELRFHTEMAYHVQQPDYLVIACARADHEHVAQTRITSVRKIAPMLGERDLHTLRTTPLQWHVDLAFRSDADPDPTTRLFLLTDGDDNLRYDGSLILPHETEEAAEALQAFSTAADQVAATVYLQPGDLVLIDNIRTSHARTPFTPRFDGTDRWLTRIFVRGSSHSIPARHADVVPFQLRAPDQRIRSAALA